MLQDTSYKPYSVLTLVVSLTTTLMVANPSHANTPRCFEVNGTKREIKIDDKNVKDSVKVLAQPGLFGSVGSENSPFSLTNLEGALRSHGYHQYHRHNGVGNHKLDAPKMVSSILKSLLGGQKVVLVAHSQGNDTMARAVRSVCEFLDHIKKDCAEKNGRVGRTTVLGFNGRGIIDYDAFTYPDPPGGWGSKNNTRNAYCDITPDQLRLTVGLDPSRIWHASGSFNWRSCFQTSIFAGSKTPVAGVKSAVGLPPLKINDHQREQGKWTQSASVEASKYRRDQYKLSEFTGRMAFEDMSPEDAGHIDIAAFENDGRNKSFTQDEYWFINQLNRVSDEVRAQKCAERGGKLEGNTPILKISRQPSSGGNPIVETIHK